MSSSGSSSNTLLRQVEQEALPWLRDWLRPTERCLAWALGRVVEGAGASPASRTSPAAATDSKPEDGGRSDGRSNSSSLSTDGSPPASKDERQPLFLALVTSSQGAGSCAVFAFHLLHHPDGPAPQVTSGAGTTASSKLQAKRPLFLSLVCCLPVQPDLRVALAVPEGDSPGNLADAFVLTLAPAKGTMSLSFRADGANAQFESFQQELRHQITRAAASLTSPALVAMAPGATRHAWMAHYAPQPRTHVRVRDHLSGISLRILGEGEELARDFGLFDVRPRPYWVMQEMRRREADYTRFQELHLFCGTWNVKGLPPTQTLQSWLVNPLGETVSRAPDVYALGFQELDVTTEAYLVTDEGKERDWLAAIQLVLPASAYHVVASRRLIGIWLVVLARHEVDITVLGSEVVPVGLLGMLGNKGGVGTRLQLGDTILTLVNCHLASDSGMLEKRNQDYMEISKRLAFPVPPPHRTYADYMYAHPWLPWYEESATRLPKSGNLLEATAKRQALSIFECDHLIWMGDLNYRLTLGDAEARARLAEDGAGPLLAFDQLRQVMREGTAFAGFEEGPVPFPPTYKYDVGTSDLDTSEKRRAPAWCDRILHFRNPLHPPGSGASKDGSTGGWITRHAYACDMSMKSSDHKPVLARFHLQLRHIDWAGPHKEVEAAVLGQFDKLENQLCPDVCLSATSVDFAPGTVRYGCPVTQTVVLENRGLAPAPFRFIPKLEDPTITKRWCHLNPSQGLLEVGERISLRVTFLLDREACVALNYGRDVLEDIAILHVDGGKDLFLSLSGGAWGASCFGNYLTALCQRPRPREGLMGAADGAPGTAGMRAPWTPTEERAMSLAPPPPAPVSQASQSRVSLASGAGASTELRVPVELWRMVDYLYRHGRQGVEQLFRTPGNLETRLHLQQCLDGELDFETGEACAPAPEAIAMPVGASRQPVGGSAASLLQGKGKPKPVHLVAPSLLDSSLHSLAEDSVAGPGAGVASGGPDLLPATEEAARTAMKPNGQASSGDLLGSSATLLHGSKSVNRLRLVHGMAECLLLFLDSLAEAVVPISNFKRCVLEGYISPAATKLSLEYLPPLHQHTLQYVLAFLQELVRSQSVGSDPLSLEFLASTFARVLCRCPPELAPPSPEVQAKRAQFLLHLLRAPA